MESAPSKNLVFSQGASHPILKDSFERFELMKQGFGVQDPNFDPSGIVIDASKEEQKSASEPKRLKISGINNSIPLKEAPDLQSLAELSNISTQSPNLTAIHSQPLTIPYLNILPTYMGFPQNQMLEEQYQMLLQTPQYRFLMDGMKELNNPRPEEQSITKKRNKAKRMPNLLIPPSSISSQSTERFILLEQPNIRQRKSYKNENRYILPNPLSICAREETIGEKLPKILNGVVSVMLVGDEGQELPTNKSSILESPEVGLVQNLDSGLSAHFPLKILDTSEGSMFRLLFTVIYTTEELASCEEKILSRPFQVFSNRKKTNKGQEKPFVMDMKPIEGNPNVETEVWIKGKGFSDKVIVTFGDKIARIIEIAENLLVVAAPQRFDVVHDMAVQVVVCNKYSHEQLPADKKLTFFYINQPNNQYS